jgi:predicted RNase H-like nuclease
MLQFVGVDWASSGWLTVCLGTECRIGFHPTIYSVWDAHSTAETILIDIPIGLPDSDEQIRRQCDEAALEYLSEKDGSLFYTPVESAVYATAYTEAAATYVDVDEGLQSQAWAISSRIREVDQFFQYYDEHYTSDDRQPAEVIRESHPEVCFQALATEQSNPESKHADSGVDWREEILGDELLDRISDERERYIDEQPEWAAGLGESNEDDFLDALCLARTVELASEPGGFDHLPER